MDPSTGSELTQRFGTPLYAYDLAHVAGQARSLAAALPAESRIYYSLKANPLPAIAREVRAQGGRAEVTSLGELSAALEAGFSGTEILVGGPAKTRAFFLAALQAGVRFFSCESLRDLEDLSGICAGLSTEAEVLLRVNPTGAPDARLAMSGVETRFGFTETCLLGPKARERVFLPGLHIRGVHVYFGTQVADVNALVANTQRILEVAVRVRDALDFDCSIVNAGGGFAWPYGNTAAEPDLTGLRAGLDAIWNDSPLHGKAQLWFESGRYLCAGSGWLLARVTDVKTPANRVFVILDTGIHHLGGMAGLGRLPRGAVTLKNLSRPDASAAPMVVDLVGPLCTPLDSLARGLQIPAVAPGDLVGIPNVGAYGLTASLTSFLSHPPPVEVAHRSGVLVEAWQLRSGHAAIPLV